MEYEIRSIDLTELHSFRNHPFRVDENAELEELAASIAEHGVLTPAIARPRPEGGYELISGHRRKAASELAGRKTMPVIVRELDDDSATILMVDSNQQRENILPSEKAFSYKMKFDAMKHQGKATSGQLGPKLTVEEIGGNTDSARQVKRYIRLTNLIPELLHLVDIKQVALSPAVELSYLPKNIQKEIYDFYTLQEATPSLPQSVRLKKLAQEKELTVGKLMEILLEKKANQQDKICFRADTFAAYFPKGYTPAQMQAVIIDLLKERRKQIQRMRNEAL